MTGPEHYRYAEQELENARTEDSPAMEAYYLKAAHVHAMLAVAAATIAAAGIPGRTLDAWMGATT